MSEYQVVIDQNGDCRFVYEDGLVDLLSEGVAEVKRASHVEHIDGLWVPDLTPVGGPVLPGCYLRADALAAERAWLSEHAGEW